MGEPLEWPKAKKGGIWGGDSPTGGDSPSQWREPGKGLCLLRKRCPVLKFLTVVNVFVAD